MEYMANYLRGSKLGWRNVSKWFVSMVVAPDVEMFLAVCFRVCAGTDYVSDLHLRFELWCNELDSEVC